MANEAGKAEGCGKSRRMRRRGLFYNIRLHRLAGRNVMPFDAVLIRPGEDGVRGELAAIVADDHPGPAALVMSRSNSRATRMPERDVSTMSARHCLVQSSTTARMRKRRPSVSWSDTKSSDQRSSGSAAPASAPWSRSPACGRHGGERRASPPDRAGTASCGSRPGPPASASREDAGSRTGDAPARSPSSAREPPGRPACWSGSEPSCGNSRWLYTPAVRSSRSLPSGERQLSAWRRASPFLSHKVLQRGIVEHGVGQKPLQARVLVLQRLQVAEPR